MENELPCVYTIAFEKQPPAAIQCGTSFCITICVRVHGRQQSYVNTGQNFAIHASLLHATTSQRLNLLSGNLTLAVQFERGASESLAVFENLVIHQHGQCKIRILLAAASYTNTEVISRIDSNNIDIL